MWEKPDAEHSKSILTVCISWTILFSRVMKISPALDSFPEECYWLGLEETPSGMREDYLGALRDINGDSPYIQPPLKIVKL